MNCQSFFPNKLFIGIVCIIGNALAVNAAVIDDIIRDFEPISGYVVMPDGGEFIIDLDDTHGISTGDIFSVIKTGPKIVHPVTQKILGSLEKVKGVLKVSRTKAGFSYARPVGKPTDIKRGDPIRRYGNLSAIFWDYSAKKGLPLFMQLQKALTDLKWIDYNSAQKSRPPKAVANAQTRNALTFILTDRGLEVRDPEFMVIKSYDYQASLSKSGTKPSPMATNAGTAAAVVAATPTMPDASVKTPILNRGGTTAAKAASPLFSEVQIVANLPSVSLVADFLNNGDQLLMASSNGEQIQILDAANKLKVIADGAPSHPGRILSLKWWTPDKDAGLYLAANIWSNRDKKVRGSLFRMHDGSLRPMIDNIPRILGTFDSNGDGRPEVLLGQEFEGETFFGRRLSELSLTGDQISYRKPDIQLPRHFTVIGSVFADVTGDGRMESIYVRNRILYVYSGNKRLYKSPKQMGGSLSFLTYDIDPTFKDVQTTTVAFEVSPAVKDFDGDGRPEILALASDRNILGSLSIDTGVKRSWLAVIRYRDGRFESGSLGSELDQPLQGLAVARNRVLVVITEPGNLMGEGASSHLLAYSLSQ